MASETTPITPTAFAAAIKELSLPLLHLKVLEIRNSIAHLDYSNEELRPFAEGTQAVHSSSTPQPDQDCIDAIAENETVIARMLERIELIKAEVEERGCSWTEFQSKEEVEAEERRRGEGLEGRGLVNGVNGHAGGGDVHEEGRDPWRDGTFQTGTISNGVVRMDEVPTSRSGVGSTTAAGAGGGSLTDEELRRRLEEQMGSLEDGDDEVSRSP
ncbi:hypothetical protein DL546_002079 [Coniochaeta pulveracea]|uniref:Secondary alcohol dehydrogenase protein n=1 Tax=Coniochaeta pulveracea TaxID=177199 RepID=A0A420XYC7_9PEZI|nr:hypothetical protein DL546_002079 [Coniochaeta pulveracea]